MTLNGYHGKRDFTKTPEPRGGKEAGTSTKKLSYVIQKHLSSHLHYDLRLESDGVLKSWAIPKGPSLDPVDKRLAIQVEDHPLEYAGFEGLIPEPEYGAGKVIVWDRGTYEAAPDHGSVAEMLERGTLKIRIRGAKLDGGFALVRTKWGGKQNNWLLIKEQDQNARPGSDIVAEQPLSVISGKSVEELTSK